MDSFLSPFYYVAMAWLDWLFPSRGKPGPDDFVHEKWESRFGLFQEKRFEEETAPHYLIGYSDRGLTLSLGKEDLFVWSVDTLYQYHDLVLTGDFALEDTAYGAVGFLIRFLNDENYYYALVSNHGFFRFDVVFNGEPIPLIPWIPLPSPWEPSFTLTALAHGDHFTFLYNNDWIAEVLDDHLASGRVGLAAQNYHEGSHYRAHLRRIHLESRPLDVEAFYQRWVQIVPPDPAQRRRLAQVFFAQGLYAEAVRQVRKNSRMEEPTADDRFMMADALVRQEIYPEALVLLDELLEGQPDWVPAVKEKAGVLYLQSRYWELKDFLEPRMDSLSADETAWNLLGHGYGGVGNWSAASEAYKKAWELNPSMPLFARNWARCLLKLDDKEGAAQANLSAAKEFYRQESWVDLQATLLDLGELKPHWPEAQALEGLWFYQAGDTVKAKVLLAEAVDKGFENSAVFYVMGLLHRDEGDATKALPFLEKAVSLEPEFVYYHFRLAETRFQLGLDPGPSAEKAILGAPNDPWILNLQGQMESELSRKVFFFEKAHLALPKQAVIGANLAQAYFQSSRKTDALGVLALYPEDPGALCLLGDLAADEGDWEGAQKHYEKAARLNPDEGRYRENAAQAAIELDQYSRAEELLAPLVEKSPNARVLTAMGDLAWRLGEFPRAEVALRTALEMDSSLASTWMVLGSIYLARQKWDRLEALMGEMSQKGISTDLLRSRYLAQTHETLQCASCGRVWYAPLVLGPQGGLRLTGEPPEDAPAGRSPATGRIYCIGCAQNHLRDNRFICPDSGEFLKLSEDRLIYLLKKAIAEE